MKNTLVQVQEVQTLVRIVRMILYEGLYYRRWKTARVEQVKELVTEIFKAWRQILNETEGYRKSRDLVVAIVTAKRHMADLQKLREELYRVRK